jgi:hypothetical protein
MRHISAGLIGAAALVCVGCNQESQSTSSMYETETTHAWAPYVSTYGPNTGVTGSSASPYAGGKAPAYYTQPSTTTVYTAPPATTTTTTTSPAPATTDTTTTTIRRYEE